MLRKLVEPFDAPPPLSHKEQGDLAGRLQSSMKERLFETSTEKPIQTHFQGLFAGLDAITSSKADSLLDCTDATRCSVINECVEQKDVFTILDTLYYHGKLSRPVASAILKSRAVTDVEHITQLVNSGGNLIKWSGLDKHVFRLQTANKYWSLKKPEKARELTTDCLDTIWIPALIDGELDSAATRGLGRAILALGGRELLTAHISRWTVEIFKYSNSNVVAKTLIPLWTSFAQAEDFELAAKVIKVAKQINTEHVSKKDSSSLFVNFLFILHEHALEDELFRRLLSDLKVYKLAVTPIDTKKDLDTTVLNKILDFTAQIQERGYPTVVKQAVKDIDHSIEHLLLVVDSYQTISMALAVQKVKVLKGRLGVPETSKEPVNNHDTSFCHIP
ncbi:hypothetical protein TRICI_006524 [Trichomonascus ciferrii]|uniref:Uncharacterized protein n=1 Tax=Trichomonascus ciferrii TaxID=44093 RepID=A0A6A1LP92_9ASCO|nr:hypothetical protein TRICI_006524 [Trichomonascus ciferrii]